MIFLLYTVDDLSRKDVIDIKDGRRIGCVRDIEISETGQAASVTVEKAESRGNPFKKPELLRVAWSDIAVIGKETVLVRNAEEVAVPAAKKGKLSDLF